MIFEKDSSYDNQWNYVRFFEENRDYYIICEKEKGIPGIYQKIKALNCKKESFSSDFHYIYKLIKMQKQSDCSWWDDFFASISKPYDITGGLKLDRKIWLHECGPKLTLDYETDIFQNVKNWKEKRNIILETYRLVKIKLK